MYKFLIPLFALALLIGCSPTQPTDENMDDNGLVGFDGELLKGDHTVIMHTDMGDITLELDADAAPKTVTNFVMLAQSGYYNGLLFHRVIPDFMLQGGDPSGNGTGGESIFGETFEDEINAESYNLHKRMLKDEIEPGQQLPPQLQNATIKDYYEQQEGYVYNNKLKSLPMDRGAIAMANRGANTNGSQFFIIQRAEGTPWLQGKHTVFGKVTAGMDVVDAIAAVERDGNDKPLEPITYTVEVID